MKTLKLTVFNSLIISLLLALFSCDQESSEAFKIVEMNGVSEFYNYSTSSFGYVLKGDSLKATPMLALPGDLILLDEDFTFYDGRTAYRFSEENDVVYNDGKIFSYALSNDFVFNQLKDESANVDLSALDHVMIGKDLPEDYLERAKAIAAKNPKVGLIIEKWQDESTALVELFKPTWISVGEASMEALNDLKSIADIQYLMISDPSERLDGILKKLPKLEVLILDEVSKASGVSEDFLRKNTQLKSVVIGNTQLTNFDFLKSLSQLERLSIQSNKSIDVRMLERLKKLTRLSLIADEVDSWKVIEKLQFLSWLVVSGDISQAEFDEVLSKCNQLNAVEILFCDEVQSLAAIKELSSLKALAITDTLYDQTTPLELSKLQYLTLPAELLQDADYAAQLQKALPNTEIVPNEGFCMGSGWFILFMPLIVAGVFVRKRYRLKQAA